MNPLKIDGAIVAASCAAFLAVFAPPAGAGLPGQPPTDLVSVDVEGDQPMNGVDDPSISADGRFVAFASYDNFLLPGQDGTNISQILVRDMQTGAIEQIATDFYEGKSLWYLDSSPCISGDGRWVFFGAYSGASRLYQYDRQTDVLSIAVTGFNGDLDGSAYALHCSHDGRYVAFESYASNIVTGDLNNSTDVFVYDRVTGITTMESIDPMGGPSDSDSYYPTVSNDGRYVAFESYASNLVADDLNGYYDIFLRDRVLGTTRRVSVGQGGVEADSDSYEPQLARDGSVIVFESYASNLLPARGGSVFNWYLYDTATGMVERLPLVEFDRGVAGGADYDDARISDDGERIAFEVDIPSGSARGGATDLYVLVRETGALIRATATLDLEPTYAYDWSFSGNGEYLAWESTEQDVVPNDINGTSEDVFRSEVPCFSPSVTFQPLADAEAVGAHAIFVVIAENAAAYQWRRDGKPLEDGGSVFGAQSDTLIINPISAGDFGVYDVLLTGPCGEEFESDSATLAEGGGQACPGDADGSGEVNFADITEVLTFWGSMCP